MRCLLLLAVILTAGGALQVAPAQDPDTVLPTGTDTSQLRIERHFYLDIQRRHIVEEEYRAGTAVEIDTTQVRGVRLRAGVGVEARRIDVRLRGVRGEVYFRATLERLLEHLQETHPSAIKGQPTQSDNSP